MKKNITTWSSFKEKSEKIKESIAEDERNAFIEKYNKYQYGNGFRARLFRFNNNPKYIVEVSRFYLKKIIKTIIWTVVIYSIYSGVWTLASNIASTKTTSQVFFENQMALNMAEMVGSIAIVAILYHIFKLGWRFESRKVFNKKKELFLQQQKEDIKNAKTKK